MSDDPKAGCQPVCADPGAPFSGGEPGDCPRGGLDKAGPGVCQYDPALAAPLATEYNCGTEASRHFADGPAWGKQGCSAPIGAGAEQPWGKSVSLEFRGGSDRGGCASNGAGMRRTTVV
eukprot:gene8314-2630_t